MNSMRMKMVKTKLTKATEEEGKQERVIHEKSTVGTK